MNRIMETLNAGVLQGLGVMVSKTVKVRYIDVFYFSIFFSWSKLSYIEVI